MTDHDAGSFPRGGVADPGPGAGSPAVPGMPLFRATGNDGGASVTGGTISIRFDGRLGDEAPVGGPGDGTCGVGTAAPADAERRGSRIALFFGDRAVEKPGEGWEAVRSGVGFVLPGRVDDLVVGGGAYLVNGRGDRVVEGGRGTAEAWAAIDQELPADVEILFWDGAAAWGSVDGQDERTPGRAGQDALPGGEGQDIARLLAVAPFRATVEDFWPSAGSNDRSASRGLSPSREQAVAAVPRRGDDAWVLLEGRSRAVSRDSGMADPTLDDLLVV